MHVGDCSKHARPTHSYWPGKRVCCCCQMLGDFLTRLLTSARRSTATCSQLINASLWTGLLRRFRIYLRRRAMDSVCLTLYVFYRGIPAYVHVYIHMHASTSICPSVRPSVRPPVCRSVRRSVRLLLAVSKTHSVCSALPTEAYIPCEPALPTSLDVDGRHIFSSHGRNAKFNNSEQRSLERQPLEMSQRGNSSTRTWPLLGAVQKRRARSCRIQPKPPKEFYRHGHDALCGWPQRSGDLGERT